SAIWSETAVRASWASVSGVIGNLLLEGHVTWTVKGAHPPNGEVRGPPGCRGRDAVLVFTSVPYHPSESTGVSSEKPGQSDRRGIRQLGTLSGVGLTLVISTVLGLWGGHVLDRWLGTAPWFMLVGLLLGIASGFVNLFRAAGMFGREGEQAERDRSD